MFKKKYTNILKKMGPDGDCKKELAKDLCLMKTFWLPATHLAFAKIFAIEDFQEVFLVKSSPRKTFL